ncbi:MAG: S8 family peptidase [Bacteroidetes bacterium]|nr:S8 family peptidase [Bacteroidota bacterium]
MQFRSLFAALFAVLKLSAQSNEVKDAPPFFSTDQGSYCEYEGPDFFGKPQYICTHSNLNSAKMLGTDKLWNGFPSLQIQGANLDKLAMWDGGAVRTTHREFVGRVRNMDSVSWSSHSTQVAGNLVASGVLADAKGMAPSAQLRAWNFTNDNNEIIANAASLFVSNHSYGTTVAWQNIGGQIYWYGDSSINQFRDWKFGYYDNRSRIWDSVQFANPYYLMVKSAGNDRGSGVAPGTPHYYWNGSAWALTTTTRDSVGPYDCLATFSNSKNTLVVGACQTDTGFFSGIKDAVPFSYSSRGPTDDGRIKPDLVAPSGLVYSPTSTHDSAYAFLGGTSMSSPALAGSALGLQELHQKLTGSWMWNSSVKALLIHSARPCKSNSWGPDYDCGWGVPNVNQAANFLIANKHAPIQESALINGTQRQLKLRVTSSTDTLKVSLCWTDPHAPTAAPAYNDSTLKLINDLDMRLLQGNSVSVYPYVLNPNVPAAPAIRGDNYRDNVEQLNQTGLSPGIYTLRISHKNNLQQGAQNFSLISNQLIEPMQGASQLQLVSSSPQHIQLSWKKGTGAKRLVLASAAPLNQIYPQDGISYNASSSWMQGDSLSSGVYVVYNDTGSALTITNLSPNQTLFFRIIEYNGNGNQILYADSQGLDGNFQTLPFRLLAFGAEQVSDNQINLSWTSVQEINTDSFLIERAAEDLPFQQVAALKGAGYSLSIRKYYFSDTLGVAKIKEYARYRLAQRNSDGSYFYSREIRVNVLRPWTLDLLYPNPFTNQFTLKFTTNYPLPIDLEIIDPVGRLVQSEKISISNQLIVTVNTANLQPGVYYIRLSSGNYSKVFKGIKTN